MLLHKPLLKEIASEGRHTFISTGMSSLQQIDEAVHIFKDASCPFELMHAVSTYPMRDEDANLKVIKTLQDRYGVTLAIAVMRLVSLFHAAAALGITSLERHITLDRAMYGSDQSASIEPAGFQQLVGGIRKIEVAMGDGIKRLIKDEVLIAESFVAILTLMDLINSLDTFHSNCSHGIISITE